MRNKQLNYTLLTYYPITDYHTVSSPIMTPDSHQSSLGNSAKRWEYCRTSVQHTTPKPMANRNVQTSAWNSTLGSLSIIISKTGLRSFPLHSIHSMCHGSVRDACLQGRPRVARPSDMSTKNIGRKECRESRRKHVDRPDGSGREYRRIGRTHQITCRLEISVLITGLDMIG